MKTLKSFENKKITNLKEVKGGADFTGRIRRIRLRERRNANNYGG